MSAIILKLVAMITMLVDHIGHIFFNDNNWMRCIGRISFPLYAFMIAEGYAQCKENNRLKTYWLRIFILALASEIPYDNAFYKGFPYLSNQNVIFTLWLALSALILASKAKPMPLKPLPIAFAAWLAEYLHSDYGYVGVLLVSAYALYIRFAKDKPGYIRLCCLSLIGISFAGFYIVGNIPSLAAIIYFFRFRNWLQLGVLGAIPFIYLYNGEKGFSHPSMQYFYRVFYPVHLAFLAIFLHI